jgi:peptide-methionine (S)-S-oxide reductase
MAAEKKMAGIFLQGVSAGLALILAGCALAAAEIPAPAVDEPPSVSSKEAVAVLSGGCFWGVEAVFEGLRGVTGVTSGYAGGSRQDASYETVSGGRTGHAESVRIAYDPAQISYGKLLQVFFAVAHDPTQLNRQGPDWGTQYRSAIWTTSVEQQRVAEAYIAQLNAAKVFHKGIVTKVAPLPAFYAAEDYHQDYIQHHPDNPYVMYNDLPKLSQLRKKFPDLLKAR